MSTTPQQEIGFYSDDHGVRVTNTRFIVGNVTYAMGNITSVKKSTEPPHRGLAMLLIAIGIASLLFAASDKNAGIFVLGVVLVLVGGVMWRGARPTYGILIASASGESTPLTSRNKERIEKIIQAVNEAIIHRG
jgi:hypothetical protein